MRSGFLRSRKREAVGAGGSEEVMMKGNTNSSDDVCEKDVEEKEEKVERATEERR